jgi:uncharacterized phage protein (TIGR01671 family)
VSREIKFRAKSLKTNEFVFGFFGQRTETSPVRETTQTYTINYILVDNGFCGFEEIEIDIKTLGQYTGLLDKNGKEIYEGDVVFSESNQYYKQDEIVWDCYDMGWDIGKKDSWKLRSPMSSKTEIIGSIYENPELIGGGNG